MSAVFLGLINQKISILAIPSGGFKLTRYRMQRPLAQSDPEIAAAIDNEVRRQPIPVAQLRRRARARTYFRSRSWVLLSP